MASFVGALPLTALCFASTFYMLLKRPWTPFISLYLLYIALFDQVTDKTQSPIALQRKRERERERERERHTETHTQTNTHTHTDTDTQDTNTDTT